MGEPALDIPPRPELPVPLPQSQTPTKSRWWKKWLTPKQAIQAPKAQAQKLFLRMRVVPKFKISGDFRNKYEIFLGERTPVGYAVEKPAFFEGTVRLIYRLFRREYLRNSHVHFMDTSQKSFFVAKVSHRFLFLKRLRILSHDDREVVGEIKTSLSLNPLKLFKTSFKVIFPTPSGTRGPLLYIRRQSKGYREFTVEDSFKRKYARLRNRWSHISLRDQDTDHFELQITDFLPEQQVHPDDFKKMMSALMIFIHLHYFDRKDRQ